MSFYLSSGMRRGRTVLRQSPPPRCGNSQIRPQEPISGGSDGFHVSQDVRGGFYSPLRLSPQTWQRLCTALRTEDLSGDFCEALRRLYAAYSPVYGPCSTNFPSMISINHQRR